MREELVGGFGERVARRHHPVDEKWHAQQHYQRSDTRPDAPEHGHISSHSVEGSSRFVGEWCVLNMDGVGTTSVVYVDDTHYVCI